MMWGLKPETLQLTWGPQKELWESHLKLTCFDLCKSLTKKKLQEISYGFTKP